MSARLIPALFAVLLAACGSSGAGTTTTTGAMMDGMGSMNMGDAGAVRADAVPGADLVSAAFELLDTAPPGYGAAEGTAYLARHGGGTTVTIELDGLPAGVDHIAHVHEGVCADRGGDHYRFDPAGSELPPNEIHLAFTSGSDGSGFMTAENDRQVGSDASAVVVHPVDLIDNKALCAEF